MKKYLLGAFAILALTPTLACNQATVPDDVVEVQDVPKGNPVDQGGAQPSGSGQPTTDNDGEVLTYIPGLEIGTVNTSFIMNMIKALGKSHDNLVDFLNPINKETFRKTVEETWKTHMAGSLFIDTSDYEELNHFLQFIYAVDTKMIQGLEGIRDQAKLVKEKLGSALKAQNSVELGLKIAIYTDELDELNKLLRVQKLRIKKMASIYGLELLVVSDSENMPFIYAPFEDVSKDFTDKEIASFKEWMTKYKQQPVQSQIDRLQDSFFETINGITLKVKGSAKSVDMFSYMTFRDINGFDGANYQELNPGYYGAFDPTQVDF